MLLHTVKKHTPIGIKRFAKHVLQRSSYYGAFNAYYKNMPDFKDEMLAIETPADELREISKNNWLANYAKNVTSQGGEDGIIAKILETIGITRPGWCVEFGACDGKIDSNSWNLINNKGWSAVLIEPIEKWYQEMVETYKDRSDVYCFNRFVNWEGRDKLDNIFAETPLPKDFELLIIDIDGNDPHVFEAMQEYRPQVLSIEFHRLIHPSVRFASPKDFSLNWSASLGTLYDLAKSKDYELVCAINWNAFFVRSDHFAKFGIKDNRPEKIHHAAEEMRLFQGYDGTLRLCNIDTLYWKYQMDRNGDVKNVRISHSDIQVLPDNLRVFRPRHTYVSRTLAMQAGKLDAVRVPGNTLLAKRRNVTSECGEDGILEAIFTKLGIEKGYAVDIGACDGKWHSQTWNLFANQGWQGIAIEKDAQAYRKLSETFSLYPGVRCVRQEVARSGQDNLNAILAKNNAPAKINFLSIDVEGDEYHLWKSLKDYSPDVVALEFNPSISNDIAYVQSYNTASPFGASLKALIGLANAKGYELAAVTDWNVIFVRKDLFGRLGISDNAIDNMYYPPFEMRMAQTMDGHLHLLTGRQLFRQDYEISFEDFQVLPKSLRGVGKVFGASPTTFYGNTPKP